MRKTLVALVAAVMAAGALTAPAQAAVLDWDVAAGIVPKVTSQDRPYIPAKQVTTKRLPTAKSSTQAKLVGTPYWYAGGTQNTTALSPAVTGIAANFDPPTNPIYLDTAHDAHSLVELAVRKTYNSDAGVVEIGITADPNVYADAQPRLFFFSWNSGGTGNGYNTNFILWSGRVNNPGDVISTYGALKWTYDASTTSGGPRWWGSVGSTYVGYFNTSSMNGGSAYTFDKAGQVTAFGEVAQAPGGTRTFSCSDMGTGDVTSSSTVGSRISSMSYNSSGTGVSFTPIATYSGPQLGYNETLLSARSLRFTGAGTTSTGAVPGNKGFC